MQDSLERFRDLVKDIEVAMLTTCRADGLLVSRPMATQALPTAPTSGSSP